jgi:hypothetical protein
MKPHVLLALAVLAIGVTVPALAQQKEPSLNEHDREQIIAIGKKNDEAKNDDAALAALFTEDCLVTTGPIVSGSEAFKKRYQEIFKDLEKRSIHVTNVSKPVEAHAIDDNTARPVGQWTQTSLGPIRLRDQLLQPFKMPKSPTVIIGTVRDLAGHPVAGARISFVEGPVPLADIAALTAADGTFSLTAPVAGIYRIACHADGFQSQSSTITIGTATPTTLNFTMR